MKINHKENSLFRRLLTNHKYIPYYCISKICMNIRFDTQYKICCIVNAKICVSRLKVALFVRAKYIWAERTDKFILPLCQNCMTQNIAKTGNNRSRDLHTIEYCLNIDLPIALFIHCVLSPLFSLCLSFDISSCFH